VRIDAANNATDIPTSARERTRVTEPDVVAAFLPRNAAKTNAMLAATKIIAAM